MPLNEDDKKEIRAMIRAEIKKVSSKAAKSLDKEFSDAYVGQISPKQLLNTVVSIIHDAVDSE